MPPAPLVWDTVGDKTFETGVDHGVLYQANAGVYGQGVAWNGLTTVTETPAGADTTALYADNIKYLSLLAAETFGGTIEAYTYPEEFAQNDGTALPKAGVAVGQQNRKVFGLSYRTKFGNDTDGQDHGYKIHLVYGALAAPSEKAFASVNDSPAAISFSWQFTTTPVNVTGLKPTALITIDSTKVDADDLASLETLLYGTATVAAALPLPDDVIALFSDSGSATPEVRLEKVSDNGDGTADVTGTNVTENPDGTADVSNDNASTDSQVTDNGDGTATVSGPSA